MTASRGKTYRPWTPEVYQTEVVSPRAKLPEGDLVFFLLDIMPQLDLTRFYAPYEQETRGAPPFDPAEMVCLLLYAYAVGLYSSRKIAQACERNLAFLAIVGADRPDFRTISDFRKLHLETFADTFVSVLGLAAAAGLVRLGHLATDGSKLPGNASRHKAMSYGYLVKEEQRVRDEIRQLLTQAEQHDEADDAVLGSRRGDELPEELKRREDRLSVLVAAKARLQEQAREKATAERQQRADEEAERDRTGKKRRGKAPPPISEVPDAKAQTNFTDPELRIMRQNNKGWDYGANAQVTVDSTCQIIVACDVSVACNDKEQGIPMGQATVANLAAAGIDHPQDASGKRIAIPHSLDNGYYSAKTVAGLEALDFDPYIATGRARHHEPAAVSAAAAVSSIEDPSVPPSAAVVESPVPVQSGTGGGLSGVLSVALVVLGVVLGASAVGSPSSAPADALSAAAAKEAMTRKLRTEEGKALYARRKAIVEPVFGQIKGSRGFRRFGLRGLAKIRGEWRLVCLTHNLLKMWRYGSAAMRTKKVAIGDN